jgi:hypothetical protein
MNKLKNRIFLGTVLAVVYVFTAHAEPSEPPPFDEANLDQMIEDSSFGAGKVQIFPARKIRFEASIAVPPQPRKTHYLLEALQLMGVNPLPEVTQGMDIVSANERPLNVYMEKTAAERAGRELIAGDKVVLFGYHVYDSKKHGPGILVADFKRHERDWTQWWAWTKNQAASRFR